jgi:hypothetical protein
MGDINAIAKQFTDFYYQTFDSGRQGLQPLYVRTLRTCPFLRMLIANHQRDSSMLTWEGQPIQSVGNIVEKLVVRD